MRLPREEFANSLTHGLGFVLAATGSVGLFFRGRDSSADAVTLIGCAVYAASLLAVYGASTLSHLYQRPDRRRLFRMLDQGFIYLLITGTYTPMALEFLRSGWWWVLFGLMWAVALAGFASKVLFAHRVERVSTAACLVLGWMPIAGAPFMIGLVPAGCLWWVMYGGISYTVGACFLVFDGRIPFFHAVWHLFVIGGSTCHYLAIVWYVLPR